MTALLHPIPVSTYHQMIESGEFEGAALELLRGMLIDKAFKSPLHRRVTQLLFHRLVQFLERQPGPWLVQKEDPLTFIDSEPEPDISIVRGGPEDFNDAHPSRAEWIIEVAVSSLSIDRLKAEIYAEAGVEEYWIVEPELEAIEVYRQPLNGRYTSLSTFGKADSVTPFTFPDLTLRLADFLPASD